MIKQYKLVGIALIGVILFLLFSYFHLSAYLSVDGFNRYRVFILNYASKHGINFIITYIVIYISLIAVCIPGTILLDILAGFIYGSLSGVLLVIFCYISGAIINFLFARYIFYDMFHHRFGHMRQIICDKNGKFGIILNLIGLRCIPIIPFWVLNILAAILEIPLWTFIVTTLIGIIPPSIIYVLFGHELRMHVLMNSKLNMNVLMDPKLWMPLCGLALIIMLPNLIKLCKSWKFHV